MMQEMHDAGMTSYIGLPLFDVSRCSTTVKGTAWKVLVELQAYAAASKKSGGEAAKGSLDAFESAKRALLTSLSELRDAVECGQPPHINNAKRQK